MRQLVTGPLVVASLLVSSPFMKAFDAAIQDPRTKTPDAGVAELVKVFPSCSPSLPYRVAPNPDQLKALVKNRQQFQLVIGASSFKEAPESNREFVATTAHAVSERLRAIGYEPIPSLAKAPKPFLVGETATKTAMWSAIKDLALAAGVNDVGIIYYVGHGSVTPNRRDLSLAVYDRPLEADEGIRVSDIVGFLSTQKYPTSVEEIPKFILVLETCYSGNVVGGVSTEIQQREGMKVLADVNSGMAPQPPKQMVVLSATAAGDSSRAFDLRGSGMSAFGYFFTKAFSEDWACVDETEDGIVTVSELEGYLARRLAEAYKAQLLEGPMKPMVLDKQGFSFLAYDENRTIIDGQRKRVAEISVLARNGVEATIVLPDQTVLTCPPACSAAVSASLTGILRVSYTEITNLHPYVYNKSGGAKTLKDPPEPVFEIKNVNFNIKQLMDRRESTNKVVIATQGGITVQVK